MCLTATHLPTARQRHAENTAGSHVHLRCWLPLLAIRERADISIHYRPQPRDRKHVRCLTGLAVAVRCRAGLRVSSELIACLLYNYIRPPQALRCTLADLPQPHGQQARAPPLRGTRRRRAPGRGVSRRRR